MAIVLEEEKKSIDWGFLLGIVSVIGIVGTAVIYLFFVNPEKVQLLTTNPDQQRLSEFSKSNLKPDEVLSGEAFQGLRTIVPMVPPAETDIGKTNPFLP